MLVKDVVVCFRRIGEVEPDIRLIDQPRGTGRKAGLKGVGGEFRVGIVFKKVVGYVNSREISDAHDIGIHLARDITGQIALGVDG
mgnify:CR=1 FL=1